MAIIMNAPYACGNNPSLDTLKLFCSKKKKDFQYGYFHIITFFNKKENAPFPNNPVTASYIGEKAVAHVKSVYTCKRINGYSKLDFYDKNQMESTSKPEQID